MSRRRSLELQGPPNENHLKVVLAAGLARHQSVDPVGGGFGGLQVAQIGAVVTLNDKAQKVLESGDNGEFDAKFGLGVAHYLNQYKPLVLIAVRKDWREVRTLPPFMRGDKDVMMAAVKGSPKALLFANDPAKTDKAVLMEAIKKDWRLADDIIRNVIESRDGVVLAELNTRKQREYGP